ncbi:hypothetical protein FQV39_29100 [Bosea sp. F3-2]|nr:hypothetical protein FQV39_29100 [Bosea sp. F3-2]
MTCTGAGSAHWHKDLKMLMLLKLIHELAPHLECDGEMEADTALVPLIRERVLPSSTLKEMANVLIFPNLDAANISYQFAKVMADALPVGPILIGTAKLAHILTGSVTAPGVVTMTAVAVVEAQESAAAAAGRG